MGTSQGKLNDAIFHNQEHLVEKILIKKPKLINYPLNHTNVTPLIKAVSLNRFNIVKLLLRNQDINLNKQTVSGETAVTRAAKFGYLEILKELVDAGSNLRIEDKKSRNALDFAMVYGKFKIAHYLLDKGLQLKDDIFYKNSELNFSGIKINIPKMRLLLYKSQKSENANSFSDKDDHYLINQNNIPRQNFLNIVNRHNNLNNRDHINKLSKYQTQENNNDLVDSGNNLPEGMKTNISI